MDATVNGIRMAYRQSGTRGLPPLLLVHGFPLDSGMWEAQLRALRDQAFVIAPDLRGHGQSDVPPGLYTIDQHADDLAALLDTLKIQKAVVAGLSMGGYVVLSMWRRHAERIAGLALLDTRANADTQEGKAARTATIQRVRERGVGVLADEMLPRLLSPLNANDEGIAGAMREMMLRQPAEGMIGALSALRDRADSTDILPTITVPARVIVGEDDIISPPEVVVSMAKAIPEGRSVLIVRAGHMSPVENPAEVNMALREVLSLAQF